VVAPFLIKRDGIIGLDLLRARARINLETNQLEVANEGIPLRKTTVGIARYDRVAVEEGRTECEVRREPSRGAKESESKAPEKSVVMKLAASKPTEEASVERRRTEPDAGEASEGARRIERSACEGPARSGSRRGSRSGEEASVEKRRTEPEAAGRLSEEQRQAEQGTSEGLPRRRSPPEEKAAESEYVVLIEGLVSRISHFCTSRHILWRKERWKKLHLWWKKLHLCVMHHHQNALELMYKCLIKFLFLFQNPGVNPVVLRYSLCISWIKHSGYENTVKAVNDLRGILALHAHKFPAVYYGLGKACEQLKRYVFGFMPVRGFD
jgi:hypothetical protein